MSLRPQASPVPHRRPRSTTPEQERKRLAGRNDHEKQNTDYGSEAGSRFEPPTVRGEPYVPVAYPVTAVAAAGAGAGAAEMTAPAYATRYDGDDDGSAETPEDMPEMSEFSHSEFMSSEFNTSHMGTEYSMYESSALAEEEGGEAGGRAVGTGEWTRHQQSQNSSQFTAETDRDNPWKNSGRDLSGRDLPGERGVVAAAGQGRVGAFTGDDGRLHDLPPLGGKVLAPSSHSVLSHDLSGFSDFDSLPSKYNRDDSGDITAPHPAPSDRRNWKRAGLTEAAALAADADAQNLVRQKQREREAAEAAAEKKRAALRTERKAAATAGVGVVPGPDGSGGSAKRPPGALAGGAAVRDTGDMKDEDESQGGMSEFRASTLEAQRSYGDPFDERPRNENGATGEYAVATYHHLIFTPIIFVLNGILLFWEFQLNGWVAESLAENPSYGPSVETLIEAGAKRTDLILDDGDWWRLISPMFLHAGVVHFLFNMVGFLQVGAMVERNFGWWRVGVIYLVAGVFGTIVSAIFVPTQVMVGASGAIFGVFGALWADLWQNWSINQNQCRMFTVLAILTVVNIVLGLMPFLDNFAHIGGMIMGFTMGLGVLVQKTEDDLGDQLNKKCYQRTLQIVSAIAVPTLMILGLSVLYGREDPAEWCSWCQNISCVEFPAGDPWWACDECSTVGFSAEKFEDGTITITCPDKSTGTSDQCSDESEASLVACCIAVCL